MYFYDKYPEDLYNLLSNLTFYSQVFLLEHGEADPDGGEGKLNGTNSVETLRTSFKL